MLEGYVISANRRGYVHDEPTLVVGWAGDGWGNYVDEGDGEESGVEQKSVAVNLSHPMRVGIFHCGIFQSMRQRLQESQKKPTILISFNTHQGDNNFRNHQLIILSRDESTATNLFRILPAERKILKSISFPRQDYSQRRQPVLVRLLVR